MERGRLQSRPRSAVFGAVALIAAVLVAGCGDDGGSTDSEAKADFIAQADYVIDLGPGSGAAGGEIVYGGPLEGLVDAPRSATGPYLRRYLNSDCTPHGNRADYGARTVDSP